nr:hypothetical protein [Bacteroidota bacterium]
MDNNINPNQYSNTHPNPAPRGMTENERVKLTGKRIQSADIMRGVGIMVIIVIHRVHYHWIGMRNTEELRNHFSGPWAPVIIFIIALFTMAGIFYFISGLVNSYAMYSRVSSGKNSVKFAMMGGVVSGIWIFMMNYLHRIFFMNGFLPTEDGADPEFPVGLVTGWVRNPSGMSFNWIQVTEPGTLSLIGLVIISVSLLLGLLLRKPKKLNTSKIYTWLIIAAIVALGLSPFVKFYIRPVYDQFFAMGEFFGSACVGHVCKEFGLFPYLGYGFLGAMIGIGLAAADDKKRFNRRNTVIALILIIAGVIMLLVFDRKDPFGSGCMGSGICFIELGLFILLLKWMLGYFDFSDKTTYDKRNIKTTAVRRFGKLALTVFLLEPLFAEIIKQPIDLVFGKNWNQELMYILLFGFLLLLLWHLILKLWEKAGFIGSIEWLTVKVLFLIAGKRSGKAQFKS